MSVSHIKEMSDALAFNIEYLKRKGYSRIKLLNGQLEEQADNLYIYGFECEFANRIDAGGDAEIRIDGKNYPGQIVNIEDKSIRLSLPLNIGQEIATAFAHHCQLPAA